MADKLSNNKDRADNEHEDHVFKSTSDSSTDLDHLQEYFDATAPSNSSQNDTTLQASKASPNQQPESEKNQQASEAFNDLANAFAIESKPSPNATVENSKEDLEVSLPEFTSLHQTSAQHDFDSSDFNIPHRQADNAPSIDHLFEDFDVNEIKVKTAAEPTSNAASKNQSPVYADLSGENKNKQRSTKQRIVFVSALLLTVSGGIYWFITNDTIKKTAPVAQHNSIQNQVAPNEIVQNTTVQNGIVQNEKALSTTIQAASVQKDSLQTTKPDEIIPATQTSSISVMHKTPNTMISTPAPANKATKLKQANALPAAQAGKATEPRLATHTSPTKQPIKNMPLTKTSQKTTFSQLIVVHPLATASVTIQPIKKPGHNKPTASTPQKAAPEQKIIVQPLSLPQSTNSPTTPVPNSKSPAPAQLATIQPTTPIQQATKITTSPITDENWIVLAPVASNKIAQQYMARFKAQHLNSTVIRLQGNGHVQHFVRIKGFHNQQEAQKQRDILQNKLGFKNVQVNQL